MISAHTGTHIREVEQQLLETSADPGMGAVLMQRAAYGLANAVVRELRGRGLGTYGSSVAVLAGKGNNLLSLVDEKGRRVVVPADKIAYVEIAESELRRVGFGTA